MKKIRRLSLLKMMSNGSFEYIEKQILNDEITEIFQEFMSHFASLTLYECIYTNNDIEWGVNFFLSNHWVAVRTADCLENSYGKNLFFALNPENKFYCVSYAEATYGKVVLLEYLVQKYVNGALASVEEVELPENVVRERIVANSFEEFIKGFDVKLGEETKKALHYCENGKNKEFLYIRQFNIRPSMYECDFKEIESVLDVKLPDYFKEFMMRYVKRYLVEISYIDSNDEEWEISGLYSFDIQKLKIEELFDLGVMNLLPFTSHVGYWNICLSFNKDYYGAVVVVDDAYGDVENVRIIKIANSFEEFVNGLERAEYQEYTEEFLYYCDEDLVF